MIFIVIDRTITAAINRIVVARIDEEFTLKWLLSSVGRMNFRVSNNGCVLYNVRSDKAPQGILVTASMLPKVKAN